MLHAHPKKNKIHVVSQPNSLAQHIVLGLKRIGSNLGGCALACLGLHIKGVIFLYKKITILKKRKRKKKKLNTSEILVGFYSLTYIYVKRV
jgi:hypothetical protein